jgi:hypothetical protein
LLVPIGEKRSFYIWQIYTWDLFVLFSPCMLIICTVFTRKINITRKENNASCHQWRTRWTNEIVGNLWTMIIKMNDFFSFFFVFFFYPIFFSVDQRQSSSVFFDRSLILLHVMSIVNYIRYATFSCDNTREWNSCSILI